MSTILLNQGDEACLDISACLELPQSEIIISLEWKKAPGLWRRVLGTRFVDLDLGCYYELRNGERCLIDWLQFADGKGGPRDKCTRQGCFNSSPYIWHTGDDQDTGLPDERLCINPAGLSSLQRLIVYAYIYDGPTCWDKAKAVLHISVPGCEPVAIDITQETSELRFCALACIEMESQALRVTRLGTFHDGHSGCDAAYRWGFSYAR